MATSTPSIPDEKSLVDLAREAVDETRDLVRIEVAIARHDLVRELASARSAAVRLGLAAGTCVVGVALLLVAVAAAFEPLWLSALLLGALALVVSGPLAYAGRWVRSSRRRGRDLAPRPGCTDAPTGRGAAGGRGGSSSTTSGTAPTGRAAASAGPWRRKSPGRLPCPC